MNTFWTSAYFSFEKEVLVAELLILLWIIDDCVTKYKTLMHFLALICLGFKELDFENYFYLKL